MLIKTTSSLILTQNDANDLPYWHLCLQHCCHCGQRQHDTIGLGDLQLRLPTRSMSFWASSPALRRRLPWFAMVDGVSKATRQQRHLGNGRPV